MFCVVIIGMKAQSDGTAGTQIAQSEVIHMQTATIRRSIIRLAGIVAIMTGLLMSSGIVSAANTEAGLTACSDDGCQIVTMSDLTARRGIQGVSKTRATFPSGPFGPHLVP